MSRRRTIWIPLAVLAVALVAGYLVAQSNSPAFPPFGDPANARFYPNQLNPQSADGAFVFKVATAEVAYLQPGVLFGASGLLSATAAASSSAGL